MNLFGSFRRALLGSLLVMPFFLATTSTALQGEGSVRSEVPKARTFCVERPRPT